MEALLAWMRQRERLLQVQAANNKGYTLIEILLVLSIFMLVVTLSLNLYPTYIKKMETRQFIKQFEADVYYIQAYAMSHERSMSILMYKETYLVYVDGTKQLLQRTIPRDIQFKKGTMDLKVMFTSRGTAVTSGVFYIQTEQERYKVSVSVGKGRLKIEEV